MRRPYHALLLAIAAWSIAAASGAGPHTEPAPGGIELVARAGRIVHVSTYGFAELEQSAPVTRKTVFRIASLTKQFTAVAVLRLVQDGVISLDDSLAHRLPECPAAWRPITIRQLLSHTSGLSGDMSPVMRRLRDDLTPAELVALHADMPLAASPGMRYEYANLNYWLLGLVIETVSGKSYAEFVRERVLAPARLTSTVIGSWSPLIPRRAQGYREVAEGGFRNAPYFSGELGYSAGGFVSTAEDLARWYHALGRGQIVAREVLEEAWSPVRLPGGEVSGYGFGWRVSVIAGHTVVHHGGSTFGFRSYVCWLPDLDLFAAVLENREGEEPEDRAKALLEGAIPAARR